MWTLKQLLEVQKAGGMLEVIDCASVTRVRANCDLEEPGMQELINILEDYAIARGKLVNFLQARNIEMY